MTQQLYYIQNGYSGNSIIWWAEGGKGYTTDIKLAGRFTEEEAKPVCQNPDRFEKAWECDYIDNSEEAKVLTVNSDKLDKTRIASWKKIYTKNK